MYLFLDIDGVLDSQRNLYNENKIKKRKRRKYKLEDELDWRNLFWVGLFCKISKAKIIMSSSWRGLWGEGMKTNSRVLGTDKRLKKWGINIEDRTTLGIAELNQDHPYDESFVGRFTKKCNKRYYRGTQILEYIEKHNLNIDDILIFDDDVCDIICYNELRPRVVQSYFYKNGFSFKQFIKAINILIDSYKRK